MPAQSFPNRPGALVKQLLEEQRQQWQNGQAWSIEAHLEEHPSLRDDQEAILQLVYNEVLLRESQGEKPTLVEYETRFPTLAAELALQFEAHQQLGPICSDSDQGDGRVDTRDHPPPARQCPRCQAPVNSGETSCPVCNTMIPSEEVRLPTPSRLPEIAGYEVLEKLGAGGMGVVYKARQLHPGRIVALKLILGGMHVGPEDILRFLTEAEAIGRLEHRNIVRLYECGKDEGLPFFTLEFVSGGSLKDRIRGQPLPPREAAQILEHLARAMDYVHSQGIVHRDLKPANILLAKSETRNPKSETRTEASGSDFGFRISDFEPKVTDFGLARHLQGGGLTQSGAIVGTPCYMAPEQARGKTKDVGPPADIYALGAILYECLTGRPPFQGASAMDILPQVIAGEPLAPGQLVRGVPRDLETICLRCLEKEPGRRYASAGDLAEDLRRFQAGEPIIARPVGTVGRMVKWVKRRPALAALMASIVVGAALSTCFAIEAARRADAEAAAKEQAQLQARRYKKGRRILLTSFLERTFDVHELLANGKVEEAVALSRTLLRIVQRVDAIDDTDEEVRAALAEVLGRLAWAELLAGKFEEAREHAAKAREYAPGDEDIAINLAHAYLLTKCYSKAEELYRRYKDAKCGEIQGTCAEVVRKDFQEFRERNLADAQVKAIMLKIERLLTERGD
jgi:serine/threonine protein kinase/Flp pilus assembly protein TadD